MDNNRTAEWVAAQNELKGRGSPPLPLTPCPSPDLMAMQPVYSTSESFFPYWNYNGLLESIRFHEKYMQDQVFKSELFKFQLGSQNNLMDGSWSIQIIKPTGKALKIRAIFEMVENAPKVDFCVTPALQFIYHQLNLPTKSSTLAKVPDSGITSYLRFHMPRDGKPSWVCQGYEMEWKLKDYIIKSFMKQAQGDSSIRIFFNITADFQQQQG